MEIKAESSCRFVFVEQKYKLILLIVVQQMLDILKECVLSGNCNVISDMTKSRNFSVYVGRSLEHLEERKGNEWKGKERGTTKLYSAIPI